MRSVVRRLPKEMSLVKGGREVVEASIFLLQAVEGMVEGCISGRRPFGSREEMI